MSDITLSKAVRSNLLSLQNTADLMATTQNRLATGKKVNSALDNPTNFFTASSLNSRAGDINQLLDGMANGIQTLEAADNGLKAITKTLESMQSTLRQARQDKSFQTGSFSMPTTGTPAGTEQLSFSGGAFAGAESISLSKTVTTPGAAIPATSASIEAGAFTAVDFTNAGANDGSLSFDIAIDGAAAQTVTIDFAAVDGVAADNAAVTAEELAGIINDQLGADIASVDADSGNLVFSSTTTGASSSLEITGFAEAGGATTSGIADAAEVTGQDATTGPSTSTNQWKTVDELVSEINNSDDLKGRIRASNDNGNLRVENLSTQDLNIGGATSAGVIDGTSTGVSSIAGNTVRADLSNQYNELRDQLDKLADDASFNGINLLRGDNLKITFNEIGTSEIDIQSKEGKSINSSSLGIPTNMDEADFDSDATIDNFLGDIKTALNEVRSQSSAFGSSLSIVQNRQDFSKNMINTLQTGASNLTLADSNEEAANLLALQTRQQLSSTALSMASQQDQAVLRLF